MEKSYSRISNESPRKKPKLTQASSHDGLQLQNKNSKMLAFLKAHRQAMKARREKTQGDDITEYSKTRIEKMNLSLSTNQSEKPIAGLFPTGVDDTSMNHLRLEPSRSKEDAALEESRWCRVAKRHALKDGEPLKLFVNAFHFVQGCIDAYQKQYPLFLFVHVHPAHAPTVCCVSIDSYPTVFKFDKRTEDGALVLGEEVQYMVTHATSLKYSIYCYESAKIQVLFKSTPKLKVSEANKLVTATKQKAKAEHREFLSIDYESYLHFNLDIPYRVLHNASQLQLNRKNSELMQKPPVKNMQEEDRKRERVAEQKKVLEEVARQEKYLQFFFKETKGVRNDIRFVEAVHDEQRKMLGRCMWLSFHTMHMLKAIRERFVALKKKQFEYSMRIKPFARLLRRKVMRMRRKRHEEDVQADALK